MVYMCKEIRVLWLLNFQAKGPQEARSNVTSTGVLGLTSLERERELRRDNLLIQCFPPTTNTKYAPSRSIVETTGEILFAFARLAS